MMSSGTGRTDGVTQVIFDVTAIEPHLTRNGRHRSRLFAQHPDQIPANRHRPRSNAKAAKTAKKSRSSSREKPSLRSLRALRSMSPSACDVDERPGRVRRFLRQQPQDGAGDLDGLAAASHRQLWTEAIDAARLAAARVDA